MSILQALLLNTNRKSNVLESSDRLDGISRKLATSYIGQGREDRAYLIVISWRPLTKTQFLIVHFVVSKIYHHEENVVLKRILFWRAWEAIYEKTDLFILFWKYAFIIFDALFASACVVATHNFVVVTLGHKRRVGIFGLTLSHSETWNTTNCSAWKKKFTPIHIWQR